MFLLVVNLWATAGHLFGQPADTRSQTFSKSLLKPSTNTRSKNFSNPQTLKVLHPSATRKSTMPMSRMGVHPKYKANKNGSQKAIKIKPLNANAASPASSKSVTTQASRPVSQMKLLNAKGQPITIWAPGKKPNYSSLYQNQNNSTLK